MERYSEAAEYLTKKDDETVKSLRSRRNGCRPTPERDGAPPDPDTGGH